MGHSREEISMKSKSKKPVCINEFLILVFISALFLTACSRRTAPVQETALNTADIPTSAVQIISATTTATPTAVQAVKTPLSSTPLATAHSSPFMGLHVNRMAQDIQKQRFGESGAYWSRLDYMHWDSIEPKNTVPKNYLWETVNEADLLAAQENGGETIAYILFAPGWAEKYPGFACGPISREALDDFAEFMSEVVRRYSAPPYNVKYWEIGNEPDIDRSLVDSHSFYGCWGEIGDPFYGGEYYAEMLKAVYPAVKAVDPASKVIVGSLVLDCDPVNPPETATGSGELRDCTPSRFLEGILEAGGGAYFDGVGFHAYDYYYGQLGSYGGAGWRSSSDTTGPVLIAKARFLKSLLTKFGYPDKELLNTELAVLCGRTGKEDYCLDDDFVNTKAFYIAQANAAALAEGLRANIWYSLTGWRGSALMDNNGAPNVAFEAFQYAASLLDNATYEGRVEGARGIMGYKFINNGRSYWLVWSLDGQDHTLSLPKEPAALMDVYGKPLEGKIAGDDLLVSVAPIYIQWDR